MKRPHFNPINMFGDTRCRATGNLMMTRAAIVIPRTKWRKPQRRLAKVSQMLASRLPRELVGFYLRENPESACESPSEKVERARVNNLQARPPDQAEDGVRPRECDFEIGQEAPHALDPEISDGNDGPCS